VTLFLVVRVTVGRMCHEKEFLSYVSRIFSPGDKNILHGGAIIFSPRRKNFFAGN
jgi:hypothetical protein